MSRKTTNRLRAIETKRCTLPTTRSLQVARQLIAFGRLKRDVYLPKPNPDKQVARQLIAFGRLKHAISVSTNIINSFVARQLIAFGRLKPEYWAICAVPHAVSQDN